MGRRAHSMGQPMSWQRGGAIALVVLLVLVGALLYLDNSSGSEVRPLAERVRERSREPFALVESLARSGRIVLLSDVHGKTAPKRLAARAIRAMATGPGLDAVVLEVPSDEQPYIDAYLSQPGHDATALLSRPAAVREADGTARAYLEIYEAVRSMNEQVGAARRIRVIAADLPGWPPPEGTPPEKMAAMYAGRPAHMLAQMDGQLFSITPDARVLVFVDGYLVLHRTRGEIRSAGGNAQEVEWLGELLWQRSGTDTRTVLIDAGHPASNDFTVRPQYRGTSFFRPLSNAVKGSVGVWVDSTFRVVTDPVLTLSSPGLVLDILPHGYTLADVADGYVLLQGGSW